MNLVTVENVSKQYSERVLLDSVNLLINAGDRIGLIGRNGSGKSTLLRMLAGEETADSGTVTIWGNVRIRYASQRPNLNQAHTVLQSLYSSESEQMQLLYQYNTLNQSLQNTPEDAAIQAQFSQILTRMDVEDGWSAENRAKIVLSQLGITQHNAIVGTLSGGQQRRVALAQALLDPADLLILDEPTNHIDAETITWLEQYLVATPNALLMVTHDRYFLQRVTNQIVELDRRELVKYAGSYTDYLQAKAERHVQLVKREAKRQTMLKRELEWLSRSPTARGTKQKARKQRVQEMAKIRYDKDDSRVAMALSSRRLGKKVLSANGLGVSFDGVPLFGGVDFHLEQGERVGVVGPNGAGKSTLLNLLAERLPIDDGTIEWGETVQLGYYDQMSSPLEPEAKVIDFMNRAAPLIYTNAGERVEAAQMLEWFLFTRPEQQSLIGSLSGGERRRLYLLYVLMRQPNVLFLDEPTNDLDVQTLQVLEQFLDHFKGSLVVVSHDRYFLDRNTDFIYRFDEHGIGSKYPSPYRAPEKPESAAKPKKTRVVKSAETTQKPRKLSYLQQRQLESLETELAELETRKQQLVKQIGVAGRNGDFEKLGTLSQELEQLNVQLDQCEEAWLELSVE